MGTSACTTKDKHVQEGPQWVWTGPHSRKSTCPVTKHWIFGVYVQQSLSGYKIRRKGKTLGRCVLATKMLQHTNLHPCFTYTMFPASHCGANLELSVQQSLSVLFQMVASYRAKDYLIIWNCPYTVAREGEGLVEQTQTLRAVLDDCIYRPSHMVLVWLVSLRLVSILFSVRY
jgi:hypothetical protein